MRKTRQKIAALLAGACLLASCGTGTPQETESSVSETEQTEVSMTAAQQPEPGRIFPEPVVTSAEAESVSGRLVNTDSSFRLKTSEDLEAQELSSLLSMQPEREFSVTKNASCDYTLTCGPLPNGEIVKLLLGDGKGNTVYSWAFQTADVFRAVSVLPEDKSTYASVDSGIEIQMTYPADLDKAARFFEISPAVGGKFVSYSSTLVFVPDQELERDTVYAVTVKKGLPSIDGEELAEDVVFSFRTARGDENSFCYAMNGISETYLPEDPVVIDVQHSSEFLGQNASEFDFTLYDYRGSKGYRKALEDFMSGSDWSGQYEIPTDGLTAVYQGKQKLYHSEMKNDWEYNYKSSFVLPDSLAEGWYLADLRTELDGREYRIQRLIQISPVSVYAGLISRQAALFVNDTATGEAARGAEITLTSGGKEYTGKTDSDGIALVSYESGSEEDGYGLLEVRYGDHLFYDRIRFAGDRELSAEEKYYTYFYTDRAAYLPSDTIRVWGVIRPRKTGISVPEKLTLRLGGELTEGMEVPVSLSADGTFTASFSFEDYRETWYEEILLLDGEETLGRTSVMICEYEKPLYVMEPVLPQFVWMPQENPFTAGIRLSYYDGTPAVGKKVQIEGVYNDYDAKKAVVTDQNGYAEARISDDHYGKTEPAYAAVTNGNVHYRLDGVENEYPYTRGFYYAFVRDLDVDFELVRGDSGESSVSFDAYSVKMENARIETVSDDEYTFTQIDEDSIRGGPVDLTVSAVLTRHWYEKKETGSYYDFISKKNIPSYEYIAKEETVGKYTVEIRNGKGSLENLPTVEKGSYCLDLAWEDSAGREMADSMWIGDMGRWNDTDRCDYSLMLSDGYDCSLKLGEKTKFILRKNYSEEVREEFTGRLFYAVYQDEALQTGISGQSTLTLEMREEFIPSANLLCAYFDGKHIYSVESWYELMFDPEERGILLTVKTDQESYAPSDTAEVTLHAEDRDGNPVAGARILLSVVDEAALALFENKAAPLRDLYARVYYPKALTSVSYIQHSMFDGIDGGGKGGGGPEPVRRKFLDTAYFAEGVSDRNGNLTVSAELPDNITSWRFTAAAVGEKNGRLYAGSVKATVPVTLPVFLNPILLSEYVEGDDITFSASCAGAADAAITAEVTGENFSSTLEADQRGEFSFGKLPIGEYKVLFRAESDSGNDAVELPFSVVKSRLTAEMECSFSLNGEKVGIEPEAWPVTVTFYNEDASLYSEILSRLLCDSGSNLNSRIAGDYARVERGWIEEEALLAKVRAETFVNGARLYSYTESDPELTALLCAAFPEGADKKGAATYFRQELANKEGTADRMASCYLGLAALGEPVLSEIYSALENGDAFGYDARLKLCAGLALLGDRSGAMKFYRPLTENIKQYHKKEKMYAYVRENSTGSSDVTQGSTRLALLTASALNLPEAEGMARFLNEEKHREYGCALERVVFLRYYKPAINLDAKASYQLNGETKTVEIDNFYGVSVSFGREQFQNADFKAVSGNVGCSILYEGKTSDLDGEKTVTVVKTIEPVDQTEEPGALYKVKLKVTGGKGKIYQIEDIVPSGARFAYAGGGSYNENFSVYHDDGQKLTIDLHKGSTAEYYIRRAVSGESVVEGALAYDSEGAYGIAEEDLF